MDWNSEHKPRLRPLETFPVPGKEGELVGLRDPSGIADVVLTVSPAALFILSKMDGETTSHEICEAFEQEAGEPLPAETLVSLLGQLEDCRFLDGGPFEQYYQDLQDKYCLRAVRVCDENSALTALGDSGSLFDEMLVDADAIEVTGRIVGVVAPHLDYARGRPCYSRAYAPLQNRPAPDRVVILGTNHFGRSASVVATASAFETPLGRTPVDRAFLEKVESRCGHLRRFELDHQREHSVELQVAWLQHLFGAESFSIVPFLCPDPCGPTGTAPYDGVGVDLMDFARTLRELVAEDGGDTLFVAGADLSHVGANFGDDRELDDDYLGEVRSRDRDVLDYLARGGPDEMIGHLAGNRNPTSMCSAGCMFVLATALRGARAKILHYHQAVDHPSKTCVTCAAVLFTSES